MVFFRCLQNETVYIPMKWSITVIFVCVKSTGLDCRLDIKSKAHKRKTYKIIVSLYQIHFALKKITMVFLRCKLNISVHQTCVTMSFSVGRRQSTGRALATRIHVLPHHLFMLIHSLIPAFSRHDPCVWAKCSAD